MNTPLIPKVQPIQQNQQIIIPMNKVSAQLIAKLKTASLNHLKIHTGTSISEAAQIYYRQYLHLFEQNLILNNQLAQIISDRNQLAQRFNQMKRIKNTQEQAVRRKRRYARDIQRLFHCPIQKCNRGYGSQGSLSHHIRLKHLDFYESGKYQIFIQKYIDDLKKNKKRIDIIQPQLPIKKQQIQQQIKKRIKDKHNNKHQNEVKIEQD